MTVEVATYVNDLQPVNPPSGDPVSQGDDHLRLIKQVLQNTFLNATRAFTVPGTYSFSASAAIVKANGEGTIFGTTTGGAITLTLPTLTALDAGWKCHFIKITTDVNPMFIAPPSGTLASGPYTVTQARRCIPGVRSTAIWTGSSWFVTRVNTLPVGCLIDYFASTLPAGYEWPNGQTLASVAANYPEYNAANGSGATPDVRGYSCIPLDNLGGAAAGHLPTTYIASSTLGAVGGVDHITLAPTNLPPYTPSGSVGTSISVPTAGGTANLFFSTGGTPLQFGGTGNGAHAVDPNGQISASSSFSGTSTAGTWNSTPFSNLQPGIMLGKLLVVE